MADSYSAIQALQAQIRQSEYSAALTAATSAPTVSSAGVLNFLNPPITVATGTNVGWTTVNPAGNWPTTASLVYVEVVYNLANNGGGLFQVRSSSAASGFSLCGTVSANNTSGYAAGVGLVPLSSSGSFDYQSTSGDSWTLRVLGYM